MANPGEAFLTSRPVYGNFEVDLGNMSSVKMVYADTTAHNCFGEDVVDAFEVALKRSNDAGVRVRTLLIVNPHNPTGMSIAFQGHTQC
jgi:bifunctional pyridoxal-dependent enzyme with beta-cystathionase and maltose regulon repressor activities